MSNQRHWDRCAAGAVAILCVIQLVLVRGFFTPGEAWGSDVSLHYAEVLGLVDALRAGDFHWWNDSANLGFASGYYYQILPQLVGATGILALGDLVAPVDVFKVTVVLPFVLLPATTYRALRVAGATRSHAVGAAIAAGLVTSTDTWGMSIDSVLSRGIYTQPWAILFAPLAVAWGGRYLREGVGLAPALGYAVLTGLCHPFIAVCLPIALLCAGWWRAGIGRALLRAGVLALGALALTAFFWLPILVDYEAFGGFPNRGAGETGIPAAAFGRLWVGGGMLDAGRWPVLTVLVAAAAIFAIVRRDRIVLSTWLQGLCFAVPCVLGPLLGRTEGDLIPAVRFLAPMQLAFAIAAGAAAGELARLGWARLAGGGRLRLGARSGIVAAAAGVLVLLIGGSHAQISKHLNLFFDHRHGNLDGVHDMAGALRDLPEGRVVATQAMGLSHRNHWWYYLPATFAGLPVVRGYGAAGLQSSGSYRYLYGYEAFDPMRHARLYNARWLLVRKARIPGRMRKAIRYAVDGFALVELDGGGWLEPVRLVDRARAGQAERDADLARWLGGNDPVLGRLLLVDGDAKLGEPLRGQVANVRHAPSRYAADVAVEEGGPATFLLKVTWHPRWHVRVDGRDAPLLRVSPNLIAVQVGPGAHHLEFGFERPWWIFALTIGAALAFGAIVWHGRRAALPLRRSAAQAQPA